MNITIPYGEQSLSFQVPDKNFLEILSPADVSPAPDQQAAVEQALDHPIGCQTLEKIVKPSNSVNIICDDMTRPTPVKTILPVVIARLRKIGVAREKIKIIMALGSHRYMTQDEMRARVGEEIYREYKVYNSEFKKPEDLVDLGLSPDGTRVCASRVALDSDIRIAVGNIVPHPTLGFGGGGKMLYPGIAGEETVTAFHIAGGFVEENVYGQDDAAVRLMVEKWVDNIGLHFIVNTVLTRNFEVYKVVAGHYVKAHRQGVVYAKEVFGRKIKEDSDVVISSSHPSDTDLWQSTKALSSAEHALPVCGGGSIIHVSPNYEGVGPHPKLMPYIGDDNIVSRLEKVAKGLSPEEDGLCMSSAAVLTRMRLRRDRIILVSDGITSQDAQQAGYGYYPSTALQQAVDDELSRLRQKLGREPKLSVITHGSEVLPIR